MRKHIKVLVTHPLISGSIVIFAGTLLGNIANFGFNIYMSRNLAIADCGVVVSIISLMILLAIPVNSIVPAIVNFAGSHMANEEFGLLKALYIRALKIVVVVGVGLLIFFGVFLNEIEVFFNIHEPFVIMLTAVTVLVTYFSTVNTAFLQARLAFNFISFSNFLGSFIKLVFGMGFVILGYRLGGVMVALLLAYLIPFILTFIPLRFIFKTTRVTTNELQLKDLILYGIPSSAAMFGITALTSTDILLVKHFFSPTDAGLYAGLSLVGKVIFFFTAPIGTVMFPLIVKKFAKNESYKNTFRIAFLIVLVCSLSVAVFYYEFPEFSILFFLKNVSFLAIKNDLTIYALFTSLYSLVSLLVYYFLSINKTFVYVPVVISAVAQAILIVLFHQSITQVIVSSLTVVVALSLVLGLFYFRLQEVK